MFIYILLFIAGILFGPLTAHYARINSIKINKRDQEEIIKARENGEEVLELPDGIDLYKNPTITFVIVSLLIGILLLTLSQFIGFNFKLLISSLVTVLLVAISIVDFQVYEIPIECNIAILLLGIINLIYDFHNWLSYLIGMGVVSLLLLIINLVTRGKMGLGDVKLMATLGLFLGWKLIILVIVLGSILGAIIHGAFILLFKKSNVLAFGPYLSIAAFVAMCYGNEIINAYLSLLTPSI